MAWIFEWLGGVWSWLLGSEPIPPPITTGLRAFLLADTTIAEVVSQRIYPLRLPQKATLPAIVLTRVSDVSSAHLRGIDALKRARYQVDCWAHTHDVAVQLGALCARRLGGFAGTWLIAGSPPDALRVTVLPELEQDLFEEEILGGLCRHSADYFVFHRAA